MLLPLLTIASIHAYTNEDLTSAINLSSQWIINDHSSNPSLYDLDKPILRQEVAWVVRRASWIVENTTCKNLFDDVSANIPNSWACTEIETIAENWIATLNNDNYNPEKNISKSEVIAMTVRAFKLPYVYDKNKEWNWQKQIVDYVSNEWYIENFSNYNDEATRWFFFRMVDTMKANQEFSEKELNDMLEEILKALWTE